MSLATNWRDNTGIFVCSRSGDDATGSGTQASPYKTMKKAIEGTTANPLTVNIRAGYYNEGEIEIITASFRRVNIISDGLSIIDGAGFAQFEIPIGTIGDRVGVSFLNCIVQNTTLTNGFIGAQKELGLNLQFKNSVFYGAAFTGQNNNIINIDSELNYQRGQTSSSVRTRKQTYIGCTINYPTTQYALTAPLGGDFNFYDKDTTIATTQNAQPYDFDNCGFESNGTAVTIDGVRIDNIQINSDLDTIGNTYASNERFSGTATINAGLANERTVVFFNCFYTDDPGFISDTYYPTVSSPLVNGRNIIGKYNPAVSFDQSDPAFDPANTGVILTDIDTSNGEFELTNPNGGRIKSSTDPNNMLEMPFETTFQEAIAIIANYEYAQGDWIDTENYSAGVNDEVRLTAKYSFYNENTATLGSEILIENGLPVEVDSNGLGNGNVNANLQNLGAVTGKKFVIDLVPRENGV